MTLDTNNTACDMPEPMKHIDRFDDDGGHFVPDSPLTTLSGQTADPEHPISLLATPGINSPDEVHAGLAVSARRQRQSWDHDMACFDAILEQAGLLQNMDLGRLRPLFPTSD